ncbi:unnamed protein product [Phytophthora fragariaefolia]|uniref:Unnamed protein product n=1 Tax=Phytophthora fragariaefolia TaxID=1490495 RepID=A0A9W6XPU9_9STRA|nr:unnamed protein product [Phytophthora fragariaefolia]
MDGQLNVGDGCDEEPFVVGITTANLLKRLDRDPTTFIFHIDATFKISQVGNPVLVLGISDSTRTFHLVAFCIISQRIESVYAMALLSFRKIHTQEAGKPVRLKYLMGDAEDGQLNAVGHTFQHDSDFIFMCFFHVMKKVQERTRYLPDRVANWVLAHIYDMHICSNFAELTQVANSYLKQWRSYSGSATFSAYFLPNGLVIGTHSGNAVIRHLGSLQPTTLWSNLTAYSSMTMCREPASNAGFC